MLTYEKHRDPFSGEDYLEIPFKGQALTGNPIFNKGTAFTHEERLAFNLCSVFPEAVFTLDHQKERTYDSFSTKANDLEKYIYMVSLQDRNETLFYSLILDHLSEMLPIVYTPTVGQACQRFSHIFRRPRGLYVNSNRIDMIDDLLNCAPFSNVSLIVVTDGERILGLGDLGAGGMGIPIGKISLYVAAAGLHPAYTLPILLDVGTNNEDLLNDPLYIGVRQKRLTGDAYDRVVEQFVTAVRRKFPSALLQWEDFGKNNAFRLMDRYKERILSFNDDIQGTGSVAMAVLFSAMRIKKEKLSDQVFVLFGQGQAGVGIGRQIYTGLRQEGLSDQEARARIYGIDKEGLLVEGMELREEQSLFVKDRNHVSEWDLENPDFISLLDTLRNAKATVLFGVTGQSGAFDETIIKAMAANTDRPLIMPLSNPTAKAECTPEFALTLTQGKCLIATGSPFKPVDVNGQTRITSQCNNLYIFPGVGLGALVCHTHKVTDEMFMAASRALSHMVPESDLKEGKMLPSIEDIRQVSAQVALAVAKEARESGLGIRAQDDALLAMIRAAMWVPKYLPYRLPEKN